MPAARTARSCWTYRMPSSGLTVGNRKSPPARRRVSSAAAAMSRGLATIWPATACAALNTALCAAWTGVFAARFQWCRARATRENAMAACSTAKGSRSRVSGSSIALSGWSKTPPPVS